MILVPLLLVLLWFSSLGPQSSHQIALLLCSGVEDGSQEVLFLRQTIKIQILIVRQTLSIQ